MGQNLEGKWSQVPAGVYTTAVGKLMAELGDQGEIVLDRLNNDSNYTRDAAKALVKLAGKRPAKQYTMMDIKELMGSRCFLPAEAQQFLGMTDSEAELIPKLSQTSLRTLRRFLHRPCPITGGVKAYDTHILFPMPPIIQGRTTDPSIFKTLFKRLRFDMSLIDLDGGWAAPNEFGWVLLYRGLNNRFGIQATRDLEYEEQVEQLPTGYVPADPSPMATATLLWYLRHNSIENRPVRTSATGQTRFRKSRVLVGCSAQSGLEIYCEPEGIHSPIAAMRLVKDLR